MITRPWLRSKNIINIENRPAWRCCGAWGGQPGMLSPDGKANPPLGEPACI